jgi:excisionase family DNA binding protein
MKPASARVFVDQPADMAERPAAPLVWSIAEAARNLGLSEASVRAAIKRKELPGFRVGRRILVPVQAVTAMLLEPPS